MSRSAFVRDAGLAVVAALLKTCFTTLQAPVAAKPMSSAGLRNDCPVASSCLRRCLLIVHTRGTRIRTCPPGYSKTSVPFPENLWAQRCTAERAISVFVASFAKSNSSYIFSFLVSTCRNNSPAPGSWRSTKFVHDSNWAKCVLNCSRSSGKVILNTCVSLPSPTSTSTRMTWATEPTPKTTMESQLSLAEPSAPRLSKKCAFTVLRLCALLLSRVCPRLLRTAPAKGSLWVIKRCVDLR
mmetsp:Transcript_7588/g.22420  ORF Transcript_7588/g.22420 Transcript_7588/m.22420 type:complete len:240 (+) Transcript_7588:444-1163(+)